MDRNKGRPSKSFGSNKYNAGPSKTESKHAFQKPNLWKERKVWEYRKANDLCFYCGEKFDPAHVAVCTKRPQVQVNALAVNDLDIPLSEDVIQQLLEEDSLPEQFGQLSLHAIAGTEPNDAIRLQAKVRNKTMLILVDSGSSHSFVNSDFLAQVNIVPIPTTPLQVQTANGHTMVTDQWVPDFTWWCQGHTLKSDMKVLQLGAYDAILGFDWLQAHSPMKCN